MNENIKISYPSSEKVYLEGQIYPDLRVGMRKVTLTPAISVEGKKEIKHENSPILVYDTSGAYGDPNVQIDLRKDYPEATPTLDIETRRYKRQLSRISSEYGRMRLADRSLDHLRFEHISLPYRAKRCKITQMSYAKKGIITPEMEYVAIRENMNCEELGIKTYITPEFVRWRNSRRACRIARQHQSSGSRAYDYRASFLGKDQHQYWQFGYHLEYRRRSRKSNMGANGVETH